MNFFDSIQLFTYHLWSVQRDNGASFLWGALKGTRDTSPSWVREKKKTAVTIGVTVENGPRDYTVHTVLVHDLKHNQHFKCEMCLQLSVVSILKKNQAIYSFLIHQKEVWRRCCNVHKCLHWQIYKLQKRKKKFAQCKYPHSSWKDLRL